jgi:hypothetical protein
VSAEGHDLPVTATLASAESFPQPVVLFRCRCGFRVVGHGRHAASLPPGWVLMRSGAEAEEICP